jgi:hypothetical protein
MTNEESDRILTHTSHAGVITVTLQGYDWRNVNAFGESLLTLVQEAARAMLQNKLLYCDGSDIPWKLVYYGKENGVLIVKRKAA